jgi:hypothetical protein
MVKNLIVIGIIGLIIIVGIVITTITKSKGYKIGKLPENQITNIQNEKIEEQTIQSKEQESTENKIIECNPGMFIKSFGTTFKVTGIERHNIRGKIVDLCCAGVF